MNDRNDQLVSLEPKVSETVMASGHDETSPLKHVQRLLWGRVYVAVILAAIFGAAFGAAGYLLPQLRYQSVGVVQVMPIIPRILYESEQNDIMPMFDTYVDAQTERIRSRRVIDNAIRSDHWKPFGGTSNQDTAAFIENLKVIHPRGSQIIHVAFTHEDRQGAMAGARAVIEAYEEIFVERDKQRDSVRIEVLQARRVDLTNELRSLRDRILSIANEFGDDSLDNIYEFKLEQLHKIESMLINANLTLNSVKSMSGVEQPVKREIDELTPRQLAVVDAHMFKIVQKRDQLVGQLESNDRFGSEHRTMRQRRRELKLLENEIETYAENLRQIKGVQLLSKLNAIGPAENIGRLEAQVKQLREMHESAKQETVRLGQKRLQINRLEEEAKVVTRRLEETEFRIEQLVVESRSTRQQGRVSVISYGDAPVAPVSDPRKKAAVAGLGAGGFVGFGLVLLYGVLRQRMRSSMDAKEAAGPTRFLGVIPEFPEDMTDPEKSSVAALNVHHIRSLLQVDFPKQPHVFAVTSARAGTGKTSLSLALGLSWAAAGARALMIDTDLAGGGLSRQTNAIIRRRIGRILIDKGLISEVDLEDALEQMKRESEPRRLGEVLTSRGVVSAVDIDHALSYQEHQHIGLIDVLQKRETLALCVCETGVAGLSVLPIGSAKGNQAARLSPHAFEELIQVARQNYDVVIVDTGPIPHSLEAVNVTPAADGVIFVMARGDQRADVNRSLDFMLHSDAHLAGVVFNRAAAKELPKLNTSAYTSGNGHDDGGSIEAGDSRSRIMSGRYGPLGSAVVNSGHDWLKYSAGEFDQAQSKRQTGARESNQSPSHDADQDTNADNSSGSK